MTRGGFAGMTGEGFAGDDGGSNSQGERWFTPLAHSALPLW
ncbi:hypothetical protein [Brenneria tiliae]|nr:hypothetical protein [Brenneria tiliae]